MSLFLLHPRQALEKGRVCLPMKGALPTAEREGVVMRQAGLLFIPPGSRMVSFAPQKGIASRTVSGMVLQRQV